MAEPPAKSNNKVAAAMSAVSSRRVWQLAWVRIAVIAGAFALVLGGLLLFNSTRLHRGPGNHRNPHPGELPDAAR